VELLLLRIAAVFVAIAIVHQMAGQDLGKREERKGEFAAALENGALRIGIDCSDAKPCNVRFGNTVHTIKTPGSVKPSGQASALVFIYVTSSGDLAAGSTINLTCEKCRYMRGITQFPADSLPLFTWGIVKGAFERTGTDFRAELSTKNVTAGQGIMTIDNSGTTMVSLDPALVSLHVLTAPKSSNSACTAGEFSFDDQYYYVCVSTNRWNRAALSNF
jgi:hypothetical protein